MRARTGSGHVSTARRWNMFRGAISTTVPNIRYITHIRYPTYGTMLY
jgi:hypothetical protein